MTQTTASFIDQLEQAAAGKEIVLKPVVELIESIEEIIEKPVEEKKELYSGSVDNATQELSSLFENTFGVSVPKEKEEDVISLPDLVAIELNSVEIVEEETQIEPTIDREAIDSATSELMSLFEIMAGVDLETGEKLLLKGPTVMLGYYKIDNPGVLEPTPNGWYDTGDIVTIDEDNFVTIQGRAKRFAKVAGEMLSLTYLEEIITQLWPENTSAILTKPDPKKGEALVLITDNEITKKSKDKANTACRKHILDKGLSSLYLPSEIIFCKDIPLLSTGKINYPKLETKIKI